MANRVPHIHGWAIYLRVSDEKKQHPEHSLDAQEQIVQERLISRSDLPVVKTYTDIVSGQTAKRPQYQQMKRDAKSGQFSHLAVYRVDRLGRNTLEGLIAFQEFIELGIEVKTASSPDINPVSPDGKFFMGMQMLMAQHETEVMKQRMNDAKRAILRQGGWPFNAPDGYLNKREAIGNGKFRTWIESDPPRFEMWRKAYDMLLLENMTLAQICHELHRQNYLRSRGKPWVTTLKSGKVKAHDNKMSRGLHRAFYAGRVVSETYGVRYDEAIQGHWEPIVSVAEYEEVVSLLRGRDKHKKRQVRQTYLLRDLLFLEYKGKTYKLYCSTPSGRTKGYSYYKTQVKIDGQVLRFPCEAIDEQVPHWLENIHIPEALIPRIRRVYRTEIEQSRSPKRDDEIRKLSAQIEQVKSEEADLVRLLIQKRIGQSTYDQLRYEWQVKLNQMQQQLSGLQVDTEVYINELEAGLRLLTKLPNLYTQTEKKQQSRLLRAVFTRLLVNTRGQIMAVKLHFPFNYFQSMEVEHTL